MISIAINSHLKDVQEAEKWLMLETIDQCMETAHAQSGSFKRRY